MDASMNFSQHKLLFSYNDVISVFGDLLKESIFHHQKQMDYLFLLKYKWHISNNMAYLYRVMNRYIPNREKGLWILSSHSNLHNFQMKIKFLLKFFLTLMMLLANSANTK